MWQKIKHLFRQQRGYVLIELLLGIMILGVVTVPVLAGLSGAQNSRAALEAESTAENIARNQVEYMFSQAYQAPPSSCSTISVPQGYAVTCQAVEYVVSDPNIEKVVVTVTRNGVQQLVSETLRAK